jgi:hypothetical protein
MSAVEIFSSMIVDKLDVISVPAAPDKTDAPAIIEPD